MKRGMLQLYRRRVVFSLSLLCSLLVISFDINSPQTAHAALSTKTLIIDMSFIEEHDGSPLDNPTDQAGDPLVSLDVEVIDETIGQTVATITLTRDEGWTNSFAVSNPTHSYSIRYALPDIYTATEEKQTQTNPEPDKRTITIKPASDISKTRIADGTLFLIGTNPQGTSGVVQVPHSPDTNATTSQLLNASYPQLTRALQTALSQGQYTMSNTSFSDEELDAFADSLSNSVWTTRYLGTKNNEYHYELTNSGQTLTQLKLNGSGKSDVVAYNGTPQTSLTNNALVNTCPALVQDIMTSAFSWNGSQAWFSYNIPELVGANNRPNCGRNLKGNGSSTPYLYSSTGGASSSAQIKLYTYSDVAEPSPDWSENEHITITAVHKFNPPATALNDTDSAPFALAVLLSVTGIALLYAITKTNSRDAISFFPHRNS